MDRRQLLKTGAATIVLASLADARDVWATSTGSAEDGRLAVLLNSIVEQMLDRSPEAVTSLGLDNGSRLGAKGMLDDRSLAGWESDKVHTAAQFAELKAIRREMLTGLNRTNYDSVLFGIDAQNTMNHDLPYAGSP